MTFFSQARRTCGTTHFIRPCTILHATGFGLPSYFEDCVFNYLLPDNDGVDDFLKSLAIPAQETCSNVPISKSI